jgi:hypothetical protein
MDDTHGFVVRRFRLEPGGVRGYDAGYWRDSLVVVERAEVELEQDDGRKYRFGVGAVLTLDGMGVRMLRNRGQEAVVLVVVSRVGGPQA